MSVMTQTRARSLLSLVVAGLVSGGVCGCAAFGSRSDSTVAQGKYYASGDAYFDQFFVDLYLLQVSMAEASKVPEAERRRLTSLLELESAASPAAIELSLHEEALKLSRAGVHLRLDQIPNADKPEAATTTLRSNARPKDDPAASLLANVETSSTNLLRFLLTMKQKEEALTRLELMTIRLDASVDRVFAQAPVGKPSEVKANLADAHKLMPLMRAREKQLRESAEQLLAALTHGIDTDDGSIGPPLSGAQPNAEGQPANGTPADANKKAAAKPRPKTKPASAPAHPKPKAAVGDGEEPAAPRPAKSKPAPAPRDFEP